MENKFYRFEFKYNISRVQLPLIEQDLLNMGFVNDFSPIGQEAYLVSSLYFETPSMADYFDKAGGFLDRKKVRARIYEKRLLHDSPNTPSIWLEIKEKHDMMIYKRRSCVSPREWDLLVSSPASALKTVSERISGEEFNFFREFVFNIASENRKPYVFIEYNRMPFKCHFGQEQVRVTLDYNILAEKTDMLEDAPSVDVSHGRAVMEVKFAQRLPWQLKHILSKYSLRRDSYSKYAYGVDATRRLYPVSR